MAILTIKEYLNGQGKTIEKATNISDPKLPKAPLAPTKPLSKGKTYSFPASLDASPNPYIAKSINVGQKPDDETGLGDLASPGMHHEDAEKSPEMVSQLKEHCGCESKKAPFVVAYTSGAYHPDPIQAIKYIVYITNENENILKALMHEARKAGCLKKYTDYLMKSPELYQSLHDKVQTDGLDSIMQRMGLASTNEAKEILDIEKSKKIEPRKKKTTNKDDDKSKGDKIYTSGLTDYASK